MADNTNQAPLHIDNPVIERQEVADIGTTACSLRQFLLFVVIPAPYYRRFAGNRSIKAFVDGITAAATGAIAGAAFVLGKRAIIDIPTALICIGTLLLLIQLKKLSEPLVILGAGVLGLALRGAISL